MPVFNLVKGKQPILVNFRFSVFRISSKKKIFIQAKILPGQKNRIISLYVHPNANLVLELTEKQAQRYLMMSENDFGRMIEDLIIITNSRLKIESVNSKVKYTQAELQRQQYFAFVAEQMQDKMKNYSQAPYIYSDPRSRSTEVLNEQGGQVQNAKKVNVYSQEQPNKSSVKQLIFNVNSEL